MIKELERENRLNKEEVDKLMRISGNVKGVVFQTHATFFRYKEGEKGIKMVEKRLRELGYPLEFNKIKPYTKWYPEALSILVILVAREVFNWKDSDIFEMGNSAPKYSFIVKLLMKFFLSPLRSFKEGPNYWKKHYDFGILDTHELNEKEKYLVIRLKEYKFHPIICIYFQGYFQRIAQYVIKSEKFTTEETKCMHRGDLYHEFVVHWQ